MKCRSIDRGTPLIVPLYRVVWKYKYFALNTLSVTET